MLTGKEKMKQKPFKVFYTEEEWREALENEIGSREREEETGNMQNPHEDAKRRLLEEESRMKQIVPDFDLRRLLKENVEFRNRVLAGYSIEDAYYLTLRGGDKESNPKKRMGMRENGRGNYMGASSGRNVASMSDEDFKKYINSIKGSKF